MSNFRSADPQQARFLGYSIDDLVPAGHPVRRFVELVGTLDFTPLRVRYSSPSEETTPPATQATGGESRPSGSKLEPLRKGLRVAMLAARADLRAAAYRIPCRVGPLDARFKAHPDSDSNTKPDHAFSGRTIPRSVTGSGREIYARRSSKEATRSAVSTSVRSLRRACFAA